MFLAAVNIVVVIMIMTLIGSFAAYKGWINDDGAKLISTLVVKIALPATILAQLYANYTRRELIAALPNVVLPLMSIMASYLFSILIAALIKLPKERRGVFYGMFTFSNAIFIGMPVTVALFGADGLPPMFLYYIANTVLFWTLAVPGFARDGVKRGKIGAPAGKIDMLKGVLSVPLVSFFISAILLLVGVPMPEFALKSAGYIGNMVTPLSSMYIGWVLFSMIKKGLRWEKGYTAMLIGRFAITPAILVVMAFFAPTADLLTKQVFFIMSGMPVMTQTAILSSVNGADVEYATGGAVLSTLASMLIIPLYMLVMPLVIG